MNIYMILIIEISIGVFVVIGLMYVGGVLKYKG